MNDVMGQLCGLLLDIPHFAGDLMHHIIGSLSEYHAACVRSHTRLTQAEAQTTQRQVRSGSAVLSAEWQRNPKVHAAIRNNDSWAVLGKPPKGSTHRKGKEAVSGSEGGGDGASASGASDRQPKLLSAAEGGADSALAEEKSEETAVLMELFGENTLHRTDIITDPQILKSLAHMHESMAWFAERVGAVAKALASKNPDELAWMWDEVGPVIVPAAHVEDDSDEEGSGGGSGGGAAAAAAGGGVTEEDKTEEGKANGTSGRNGSGNSNTNAGSSMRAAFAGLINKQIQDVQIQRLKQIARGFRGISKACLVLLRLELRCHTLMYVSSPVYWYRTFILFKFSLSPE